MTLTEATARRWKSDGDQPGYYGQPVLQPAPWKREIALYLFTGGLAGASSVLAAAARLTGRRSLARHARRWALAGFIPSPILLVLDLGRRDRFFNMLRVLKPTSPMSIGSWLLAVYGPTASGAALLDAFPRRRRTATALDLLGGVLGAGVATYTAVLVSDTATPVWHEARQELPFVFAASAAASAGAASAMTAPRAEQGPAQTVAIAGALGSVLASRAMEHRLGRLARARRRDRAGRWRHLAGGLSLGGSGLLLLGRRSRTMTVLGALAVLGGSVAERFCVLESGKASATDPTYLLASQNGHG